MLIRPAIGDTDPIRYRRPTPDDQFSGNILDEAMRVKFERRLTIASDGKRAAELVVRLRALMNKVVDSGWNY
jgi:hypothetical protein